MSLNNYKDSIKSLVDSTNDEMLLKNWKMQLEWDIAHRDELELSAEELNLVQEGITNYNNGEVMTLGEYISKKR